MNDTLKWLLIGGVAYYVYRNYFSGAAPAAASSTPASSTPTTTTATPPGITPLPPPTTTIPPPTNTVSYPPGTAPTNKFDSIDYGNPVWLARVGTAMQQAAGNDTQKPDDWSWFYQNSTGGSPISAALFQGILEGLATRMYGSATDDNVTQARSSPMASSNFLSSLVAAKASGLSGIGKARMKVPVPFAVAHFPNGRKLILRGRAA